MLLINADDFGRSTADTDAALTCWREGNITSVSAMVFMADSERAAKLARENGLKVGLHLNFTEQFTGPRVPAIVASCHNRIIDFLTRHKYSQLLYNPFLRDQFRCSYQAQMEQFEGLFGRAPSHIDGHHHMHLCANLLLSNLIPTGMRIRRNFSFLPGEKSWLNRTYRSIADRWLARKYRLTDYFFDLTETVRRGRLDRVINLAKTGDVELMTHPGVSTELECLRSAQFQVALPLVNVNGKQMLQAVPIG
jgi:predicted glycoside hydrolase/deacetylase ChbG (UPF0249 family)